MKTPFNSAALEREWGIVVMATDWLPGEFKRDFDGALDAQPSLITTASSGIPFWMMAYVDPEAIRILQAPIAAAKAFGEVKKGDWTTQTAIFMTIEQTGEVASYGDFSNDGRSDVNANFPQRQSYLFQTHIEYGDREVAVAGEAKLQLVAEKQASAALTLNRFQDYTYHLGLSGLQLYGLLNDPSLPAALTPATKTAGGVRWVISNVPNANALEVYNDVLALYTDLATRNQGRVDSDTAMTMVIPPALNPCLGYVNQYGLKVRELLKDEFPNLKIVQSPRYATGSGNVIQLWVDQYEGKDVVQLAFNEKMRQHQIVNSTSSKKQKTTAGTWGAVIRYPIAVAQMLGA